MACGTHIATSLGHCDCDPGLCQWCEWGEVSIQWGKEEECLLVLYTLQNCSVPSGQCGDRDVISVGERALLRSANWTPFVLTRQNMGRDEKVVEERTKAWRE